jgi:hypothetical protein
MGSILIHKCAVHVGSTAPTVIQECLTAPQNTATELSRRHSIGPRSKGRKVNIKLISLSCTADTVQRWEFYLKAKIPFDLSKISVFSQLP